MTVVWNFFLIQNNELTWFPTFPESTTLKTVDLSNNNIEQLGYYAFHNVESITSL